MPTRPHLTPEENGHLREVVRGLVVKHGTQSAVARLLGIHQTMLSASFAGRSGFSHRVRCRILALAGLGVSPDALDAARSLPTETLLAIVRERMTEGA